MKLEDEASHVAVDPPKPVMQVFVPPPDDSDAVAHDDGLAPMAVGEDDSVCMMHACLRLMRTQPGSAFRASSMPAVLIFTGIRLLFGRSPQCMYAVSVRR